MAKEFAEKFYNSKAWKKCRAGYIAERRMVDGGLCEECKEQLGYIVHHKITLTASNINDPDISLNFNNLKYDCKRCHDEEEQHAFIKKSKLLCTFDKDGQPIPIKDSPP